jgi:hypothetical protein
MNRDLLYKIALGIGAYTAMGVLMGAIVARRLVAPSTSIAGSLREAKVDF